MRIKEINLKHIGLPKIGIKRIYSKEVNTSLLSKIEGITISREITDTHSLVANGTLTDTKWAKVSTVKGNSVVWNQLVNHSHWKSTTNNGITFTVEDDGKIVVNGTSTGLARIIVNPYFGLKANHKYVLTGTPNNSNGAVLRYFGTSLRDEGNGSIINITTDAYNALAIEVTEGLTVNNAIFYPRLTDLTQMFGAGNEPTTIEEFEARKPIGVTNDYNEGEILSYQQWGEKVIWNQLFIPDYQKVNCELEGNTITRIAEGKMYIRTNNSNRLPDILLEGHKYVASVKIKANNVGRILFGSFNSGLVERFGYCAPSDDCTQITQLSTFFTWRYTQHYGFPLIGTKDDNITSIEFEDLYVVDLTIMFGEGNEPTTIEEFERRRPRNVTDEYNEGTEINGDIEIKSVGLNQWDEEWEVGTINSATGTNSASNLSLRSKNFISVIGGGKYKYVAPYSSVITRYAMIFTYDNNKQFIRTLSNIKNGNIVTMPTDACYCKITHLYYIQDYGTYNNDICLHLVQDGLVSQYKPYTSTTTLLPNVSLIKDADGNQLFPYGLLSAGSAYDEITETKAIKRIGVVDMGTLNWSVNPKYSGIASVSIAGKAKNRNLLTAIYTTLNENFLFSESSTYADKTIAGTTEGKGVYVKDTSYTDAASFKQAMQGVLLYYELAEPIEVDIPKWKAEYKVEQGGTEQIVSANDTTNLKTDIIYGNKV